MPRTRKPSGGRFRSKTCRVRLPEFEPHRWMILKAGARNTTVAAIGPDGLTTDDSRTVPSNLVYDVVNGSNTPPLAPAGPVPGVVGERGLVTIPADIRRQLRLAPGSPILFDVVNGEIRIVPAEVIPRRRTLDELLAGVTDENRHGEIPVGVLPSDEEA